MFASLSQTINWPKYHEANVRLNMTLDKSIDYKSYESGNEDVDSISNTKPEEQGMTRDLCVGY